MYSTSRSDSTELAEAVPIGAGLWSVIMAFPGYILSQKFVSVCIQVRLNSLHAG